MVLSACAFGPQYSTRLNETRPVVIRIVDEREEPIAGAVLEVAGRTLRTNDDGESAIKIAQPVTAVVSADGKLTEPIVIGPGDVSMVVRLWDRVGPDGIARNSMHFGGDVMLGRRYLEPTRPDTPLVTDAESARHVVGDLAPLSAAADWTVVNLETVIGDLPIEEAYPAKRFLLQSSPYVTELLDELGVDLVTLGNNHAYDWGEAGLATTFDALDRAGIDYVGAGYDREEALEGRLVEVGSTGIGIVSFTTVNGSFVNDQLPSVDEPLPVGLPASEIWQYSERSFSYGEPGDRLYIREGRRRISEIWTLYEQLEGAFGEAAVTDLWMAMTDVYPELQDWVARRGHGGAAPYRRDDVEDEIRRLQQAGAKMIVVQVHGGFQFADVKSEFVQRISHDAIDAGADIVVAHHPHVLQGVEWYRDKLIVYSLGNLVFDQDFLETFPTAMLRVVTEGSNVLEARLLPVVLDRYRPVPVAGTTAARIVRTIDERSALHAVADRVDELEVGSVAWEQPPERAGLIAPASLRLEHNSAVVLRGRTQRDRLVATAADGVGQLGPCLLVRTDLLPEGTEVGVDLFGWGRFDDDTADGHRDRPLNWRVPDESDRWARVAGRTLDPLDDAIELLTDPEDTSTMRLRARIDLDEHRLFDNTGAPLDAPPRFEIRMDAKRSRGEEPSIRFVTFDFSDSDPTVAPESVRLREIVLPIEIPADGEWHSVVLPLPDDLFVPDADGNRANTATMLIDTPPALRGQLALDNVQILEWRGAAATSGPAWAAADLVRSEGASSVDLATSGC